MSRLASTARARAFLRKFCCTHPLSSFASKHRIFLNVELTLLRRQFRFGTLQLLGNVPAIEPYQRLASTNKISLLGIDLGREAAVQMLDKVGSGLRRDWRPSCKRCDKQRRIAELSRDLLIWKGGCSRRAWSTVRIYERKGSSGHCACSRRLTIFGSTSCARRCSTRVRCGKACWATRKPSPTPSSRGRTIRWRFSRSACSCQETTECGYRTRAHKGALKGSAGCPWGQHVPNQLLHNSIPVR